MAKRMCDVATAALWLLPILLNIGASHAAIVHDERTLVHSNSTEGRRVDFDTLPNGREVLLEFLEDTQRFPSKWRGKVIDEELFTDEDFKTDSDAPKLINAICKMIVKGNRQRVSGSSVKADAWAETLHSEFLEAKKKAKPDSRAVPSLGMLKLVMKTIHQHVVSFATMPELLKLMMTEKTFDLTLILSILKNFENNLLP